MAIKMSQGLKLSQNLMMTPQLQQAIKLLTLTHLEMTTMIAQEMVENPVLEEMDQESEVGVIEQEAAESKEATAEDFSGPELVEKAREDFDWEAYAESFNSTSYNSPNMKESFSGDDVTQWENLVTKTQSLQEHLEWQLQMEDLSSQKLQFALRVIHDLDDEGYLTSPQEELISLSGLERDEALGVIGLIQQFDPVGCAANDLKECLLVQARLLPERSPLVERLIDHYLDYLKQKDYQKIAKELGISKNKIQEAEAIIMAMNPKPGRLVGGEETHYVVPDIFIQEVSGEFVVAINDEGVPRLRVSHAYRDLLKKRKDSAREAENTSQSGTQEQAKQDVQDFVQDKIRSALWLIKSIENRQRTIVKVAESIVRNQQEFFRKGPAFLKPMILKDVAGEIGMHESTVSRVTTNKYMHTPIGTFELKYFFNAGIGGKNGGIDIAGESLKLKIKDLISKEDPKRPLSDQKISELLSTKDIMVARRTVAKYREGMNILPSSKRKKN
jgi:RNA polymerase sigma-54 factor